MSTKTLRISKSSLSGNLRLPPSKSQTLRALLFALLADGESHIFSPLNSPDTEAMIRAIEQLGATVKWTKEGLTIKGVGGEIGLPVQVINAGNSGIVYRFITALCALQGKGYAIVTGDESIRDNRPIFSLLNAIQMLGGTALSTRPEGGAPIIVKGPLHSGRALLDGRDSQPVSALLIACCFGKGPFEIEVKPLDERPWLNLTLSWLNSFGFHIKQTSETTFWIAGNERLKGFDYRVPADFSSLAYPVVAALITGSDLIIEGLDFNDTQGDKALFDQLTALGASIEKHDDRLIVKAGSSLKGGEMSVAPFVDALPLLAVLGCFCSSPLTLSDAAICRLKESDRIHAIATELKKMGGIIEERYDSLTIYPSKLKGAHLSSHKDHRIALSLAIGAMACNEESHITDWECTLKSYPQFIQDFQQLGAIIV